MDNYTLTSLIYSSGIREVIHVPTNDSLTVTDVDLLYKYFFSQRIIDLMEQPTCKTE